MLKTKPITRMCQDSLFRVDSLSTLLRSFRVFMYTEGFRNLSSLHYLKTMLFQHMSKKLKTFNIFISFSCFFFKTFKNFGHSFSKNVLIDLTLS